MDENARLNWIVHCAASKFYNSKNGKYQFRGRQIDRDEMIRLLEDIARSYPLFFIEDPLDEDDFEGFAEIIRRLNILIVGDDLFATNIERLKKGIELGSANGIDTETQYGRYSN